MHYSNGGNSAAALEAFCASHNGCSNEVQEYIESQKAAVKAKFDYPADFIQFPQDKNFPDVKVGVSPKEGNIYFELANGEVSAKNIDEMRREMYTNAAISVLGTAVARISTGMPTRRLSQDISVKPTPPAALPLNRPIGLSPTQNARMQQDIIKARAQGATDFRVNQHQVNSAGERVGINRPDLQYTDANGKRVYVEYDTSKSSRGAEHAKRINANDPNGTVVLVRQD